jgi:hypothetical protein
LAAAKLKQIYLPDNFLFKNLPRHIGGPFHELSGKTTDTKTLL